MAKKKSEKKSISAEVHTTPLKAPVFASKATSSPESLSASVSVQERIALLAYTYWEQRGRAGGTPEEDWFRAEREILSQMDFAE